VVVTYSLTLSAGDINVSVESDSQEELLSKVEELRALARRVAQQPGARGRYRPAAPKTRRRVGKSEAIEVLRHLEEKLIPSGFFREPRSTRDTRFKLKEQVGVLFQSRKVSQALGIMYSSGKLRRTGLKGAYRYYAPRA